MTIKEEINKAIGAHGKWKFRLDQAIEKGSSEFTVDIVRKDDQCDFGRWLHGSTIPASMRKMPEYESCVHLHATFHQTAADVLKLATTGHKAEALAAMHSAGKFAETSTHLVSALVKCRSAIDKAGL